MAKPKTKIKKQQPLFPIAIVKTWVIYLFIPVLVLAYFLLQTVIKRREYPSGPTKIDPNKDSYNEYRYKSSIIIAYVLFGLSLLYIPISIYLCYQGKTHRVLVCEIPPFIKLSPFISFLSVVLLLQFVYFKRKPRQIELFLLSLLSVPFLMFCLFLSFWRISI